MRHALFCLAVVAMTGCDRQVTYHAGAANGAGGGSSALSSTGTSAAGSGSTSSGGTGGSAPGSAGRAFFDVRSLSAGEAQAFILQKVDEAPAPCTTQNADGCIFQDCGGGAPTQHPKLVSAGDITIAGGTQVATLSFGANGYAPFNYPGAAFQGGETLTLSAPGSTDAPPFQVSVEAPLAVTITAAGFAPKATIVRSQGLPVQWTPVSFGEVDIQLVASVVDAGANHVLALYCPFSATSSGGGLPASGLLLFPQTDSAQLFAFVTNTTNQDVGSWSVAFRALRLATTSIGPAIGDTITLE